MNRDKIIELINELHVDREGILEFCRNHSKLYLYGAGSVASRMIKYLENENIILTGIVVSNIIETSTELNGYKILNVRDIDPSSDVGIILAVAEVTQEEIISYLKEIGKYHSKNIYCQRAFSLLGENIITEEDWYAGTSKDGAYFNKFNLLDSIGLKYETDKNSGLHSYLRKYDFVLNKYREDSFNLLELGVLKGQSLDMWSEYFLNANIVGVDINEECERYSDNKKRVIISDLSDVDSVFNLRRFAPKVIIDDASHIWSHQILALSILFESLENGGVYIVEDVGTSFLRYKNSFFSDTCFSAYEFCRWVNDIVTGGEIEAELDDFPRVKEMIYEIARDVDMVCFIYGSVIFIKK